MTGVRPALFAAAAAGLCGCAPNLDLGSDVLWTARHEGGDLGEWMAAPGGSVGVLPPAGAPPPVADSAVVSAEQARDGRLAAKLTVVATAQSGRHNVGLSRRGSLPPAAYYSAWYQVASRARVGVFWVIFKIRRRTVADDPTTEGELFDVQLHDLPGGEMVMSLYDHRSGDVPLVAGRPVVPVGRWFHLEAFYRNADDATGHFTLWLDGVVVADLPGQPTGAPPWTHWVACNVADDLDPSLQSIYIDDAAVSLSRVGPDGVLAR